MLNILYRVSGSSNISDRRRFKFGLAHVLMGIHIDTFWTALVFAVVLSYPQHFCETTISFFLHFLLQIITLGLFLFRHQCTGSDAGQPVC